MIVRHIPMKNIRKSSFVGLVDYLTSGHGKQERVGEIRITNCQSNEVEWALHEVQAVQEQNQRAKGDRTYHLLISFPAGEIPSTDALKDIENRICASIGYAEHQRISVVHYDTDNFHMHVSINKVHPTRFTLHEPYLAYKKLGEIATQLEIEHGLQQVNHIPNKIGSENRADDMEHHAGIASLLNWIKSECLERLQQATHWSEFHYTLQQRGLKLIERGNGLVIVDASGIGVKASSVSRDFSKGKLEKQFGPFEKTASIVLEYDIHYSPEPIHMKMNTSALFSRYQIEQNKAKAHCPAELSSARARKNKLIEAAKRTGRLKRAAIKLMGGSSINKKILYALASKALQDSLEQAKTAYLKERETIYLNYQRRAWADWLKFKANQGDVEALKALRSREVRQNLKGNVFTGKSIQGSELKPEITPDNITKTGTIIYRVGTSAIRDDGELIKISRGSSEEGIAEALRMAISRYGQCITVNGSEAFKEQIVQVAAKLKLNLNFDNAALELRRQDLLTTPTIKEKDHESTRQSALKRRRTNRGSNEGFGAGSLESRRRARGNRASGWSSKPNLGRIGQQPPPESKNRLRGLSQLGMVQLARGGEMLLPSHVSSYLEHQRSQSNNGLRRDVSGAGAVEFTLQAADKYIAERELKRQKLADIPKHRRYNKNDEGPVQFAGIRQIDGELLALLKRDDFVVVLPIDSDTAHRMKRLSIGEVVKLTARGTIVSRGRSR